MNYDGIGKLTVKTYAASGAVPVENVLVKIYGVGDYNKDTVYSLLTDNDGLTNEVELPAPSTSYSTSPGAPEEAYAVYNVELVKDGFYPKRISSVPIFSNTSAMLPIEMIPLSYFDNGNIIPQNNLNSVIYENENLQ